jgi:hypothetical protein
MPIMLILVASMLFASGGAVAASAAPLSQLDCVDGPPVEEPPASSHGVQPGWHEHFEGMPMSANSLRFIIAPDNYHGDGLLMVQIDSGVDRRVSADREPFVRVAVGKWDRSCMVQMPLDACPAAVEVLEQLKQLQIPIGHGMQPLDSLVLHATAYSLQFHGAELNRLTYRMGNSPLELPLEQAKAAMKSCWQPVAEAVQLAR